MRDERLRLIFTCTPSALTFCDAPAAARMRRWPTRRQSPAPTMRLNAPSCGGVVTRSRFDYCAPMRQADRRVTYREPRSNHLARGPSGPTR